MTTIHRIFAIINEQAGPEGISKDAQSQVNRWDESPRRKVHDWRNHVPPDIIEIWNVLGLDVRLVAYFMAEEQARNEEWD